ncbi:MAG TPA: hypothetical protein EYP19_01825 [Desulfobacterales bacterium]|nr:hypothetical protein [Desulfobacterales bacterium]
MEKDQVLKILSKPREELNRHGVKSIALFGSGAIGENSAKSDGDVLVKFDPAHLSISSYYCQRN